MRVALDRDLFINGAEKTETLTFEISFSLDCWL